jgi:hypothetical protein
MNYINHLGYNPLHALAILHILHSNKLMEMHAATQRRIAFLRSIPQLAEGGFIAIVEDGRDCDCVQYTGRVHVVAANKEAIEAQADSIAEWADGPFELRLERPSVASKINPTSRDLAMEAYEDGHPHYICA